MGEKIAFENGGRISDFQALVTLTLDGVILHHLSTSTYKPNFVEIEETFCGLTDGRTYGRTFETHFIRSTWRSRPKKHKSAIKVNERLIGGGKTGPRPGSRGKPLIKRDSASVNSDYQTAFLKPSTKVALMS